MKIRSSGSRVVPCGWTTGQTDRHDEADRVVSGHIKISASQKTTVAFRSFADAPKNKIKIMICLHIHSLEGNLLIDMTCCTI